jgi:hypothetical protein
MTHRHSGKAARLTATIATLFAMMGLLASSAGASINGSASLTLSGAGKGTLHEGSGGLCTNARGDGVDLIGLQGSISGFNSAATWSLVVATQSGKAGTYPVSANGKTTGQLDPMVKNSTYIESEKALLNSSSGTLTFNGEKGTLNVTFGTGKKAVTVKGSWNCSA